MKSQVPFEEDPVSVAPLVLCSPLGKIRHVSIPRMSRVAFLGVVRQMRNEELMHCIRLDLIRTDLDGHPPV